MSRNMVVVSTTADALNGVVSSLSALKAKPGRDGISLREALSAADRTGGSPTVHILFSAALTSVCFGRRQAPEQERLRPLLVRPGPEPRAFGSRGVRPRLPWGDG